jgi:hypothetical protein
MVAEPARAVHFARTYVRARDDRCTISRGRQVWVTIGCKHCGREGRYEIDVPDNRVRLDAVEKLLQQGLGRAREAEESRVPRLPESAAAVTKMFWRDQQALAHVLLVEEIAAVAHDGGKALMRNRIATLTDDERRLLQEALAAAA